MPLIHHIQSLHAGFMSVLVTQLTLQLLSESVPGPGTSPARDGSYDTLIAAWVIYLLDTQTLSAADVDQGPTSKTNVIPIMMSGVGPLGLGTVSEKKT